MDCVYCVCEISIDHEFCIRFSILFSSSSSIVRFPGDTLLLNLNQIFRIFACEYENLVSNNTKKTKTKNFQFL